MGKQPENCNLDFDLMEEGPDENTRGYLSRLLVVGPRDDFYRSLKFIPEQEEPEEPWFDPTGYGSGVLALWLIGKGLWFLFGVIMTVALAGWWIYGLTAQWFIDTFQHIISIVGPPA